MYQVRHHRNLIILMLLFCVIMAGFDCSSDRKYQNLLVCSDMSEGINMDVSRRLDDSVQLFYARESVLKNTHIKPGQKLSDIHTRVTRLGLTQQTMEISCPDTAKDTYETVEGLHIPVGYSLITYIHDVDGKKRII